MTTAVDRFASVDWAGCSESLWQRGYAHLPPLLTPDECAGIAALYTDDSLFRSKIVMERFRFGKGEYKYFKYPLPPIVQELREQAYPRLADVANAWGEALGASDRFPASLVRFLKQCHEAGQNKPTPLLLRYGPDDYNCMHQDIYGAIAFPLQMAVFISSPDQDFEGGEFVLAEQQPRAQTKVEVLLPRQGEAVVFTTRYRPVRGARGCYRVNVRHGVSRVRSGERYTLGIIFHDAQ